jgi:hypothetical protein
MDRQGYSGEQTMKRMLLVVMIIMGLFSSTGCMVISCEEHLPRHHRRPIRIAYVRPGPVMEEIHIHRD